jgi:eukaryotic-like serine/threonine-protein kinase
MTSEASNSDDRSRQIDAAIAEYLEALEKGSPLDQEAFLAQHADIAGELRQFTEDDSALKRDAPRPVAGRAANSDQSIDPASPIAVALSEPARTSDLSSAVAPGTTIGARYRLLEVIGEGGMGTVWMAEQREPMRRMVALKLIKPGMASKAVLTRFGAERQALALMDHPNIAKVLDGGTTADGRPYFVMELVRGIPLTQYCDERRLPVAARLDLFVQVCQAVQHAHQKGIIHRDIKPTNILVTEHDGRPVPKVIDFGLAKALQGPQALTEHTMFTAFGAMVGTPLYMAPEQVGINALDVDTRSDVYALGVILYELLTGSTPLEKLRLKQAAWDEICRLIREEEPPRPSMRLSSSDALPSIAACRHTEPEKLGKLVRGELDWIVLKALEKDRNRRYESAKELMCDIERYLTDESVQACPPSAAYRFKKLARRHKVALFTAGIVSASLLLGMAISLWQATLARRAEELAQSRLTAEIEARQQTTAEAAKAIAISSLLQKVLQSANPDEAKGADYMVREQLDDFSAGLGDQLNDDRETAATIHAIIGNAYRGLGLLDKAEPHLKLALDLRQKALGPDRIEVAQSTCDFAWCLFERRDPANLAEAEKQARRALSIHRKLDAATLEIFGLLQNILNSQQRFEDAKETGQQALEIARQQREQPPEMAAILQRLAETLIHQGDFAKAESLARESVKLHRRLQGDNHPGTATGQYILAWTLQEQGKFDEAEQCCHEALNIFLKEYDVTHASVQLAFERLETILNAKHDEAGLATLHAEMSARKNQKTQRRLADSDLQLEGAQSIFESGDYYAALAVLDDVIRKHPDLAKAWELRGRCCRNNADFLLAIKNFTQAIKLNPRESLYWFERASNLMMIGEFKKAIADCSQAIELDKQDVKPWSLRANCYAELGQWDKAEADFIHADELGDRQEDCVAVARMAEDNLAGYDQMCVVLLEKATPTAPETWIGCAVETSTFAPSPGIDPDKIVTLAQRLIQFDPHSPTYMNSLGAALYRAGRFEEAKKQLAENSKSDEAPGVNKAVAICDHLFLAMTCQRLHQSQEARRWLDRAAKEIAERPSTILQTHETYEWQRRVVLQKLQQEATQLLATSKVQSTSKKVNSTPQ